MYVFWISDHSFYPSTASVRADSLILERYKFCCGKKTATQRYYIVTRYIHAVLKAVRPHVIVLFFSFVSCFVLFVVCFGLPYSRWFSDLGQFLCSRKHRYEEKAGFRSETKSGFLLQLKMRLLNPRFSIQHASRIHASETFESPAA